MSPAADGGGSGEGREIRLGADTGESIAGRHDRASDAITDTADTAPEALDGGEASVLLGRIVAGVGGTAERIAQANQAAAVVVRDVDGDLGDTEAEVATVFRTMTQEIS